jgi:DNA-binding beta-propeller fold protein YncE
MIGKVPAPNGTQGIAASPDGRTVVAIDMKEPVAIVIDPATDTVRERVPLGQTGAGYKPYFSPDGSRLIIISTSTASAQIFDAANLRGPHKDVKVGRAPMGVAFSSDGHTALIANHGEGTVSAIDLRKSEVTTTFKAGTGIETLTYY